MEFTRPKKRQFIPDFDSYFGEGKRFKTQQGKRPVQQGFCLDMDIEDKHELESKAQYPCPERDQIMNCAFYNQKAPFRFPKATKPQPFNFMTDNRAVNRHKSKKEEIESRPKFKARPVPKSLYNPSVVSKHSHKPPTKPNEFSFNSKHKSQPQPPPNDNYFKALPLNKEILDRPNFVPKKHTKQPTKPVEFDFETTKRSLMNSMFSTQSSVDSTEGHKPNFFRNQFSSLDFTHRASMPPLPCKGFSARPVPNFSNPFQPVHNCQFTEPQEFTLNSQERAEDRKLFEEELREKERRREAQKQAQEEQRRLQEEMELKQLRKNLVFKARPVPEYQSLPGKPGTYSLTQPNEPQLMTSSRASLKAFNDWGGF